jgi:hypothetical protein
MDEVTSRNNVTLEEFENFLLTAQPGHSIVYARGDLTCSNDLDNKEPMQVAALAWTAYEDGVVCLTQRAPGPPPQVHARPNYRAFSYIATRTTAPRAAAAATIESCKQAKWRRRTPPHEARLVTTRQLHSA